MPLNVFGALKNVAALSKTLSDLNAQSRNLYGFSRNDKEIMENKKKIILSFFFIYLCGIGISMLTFVLEFAVSLVGKCFGRESRKNLDRFNDEKHTGYKYNRRKFRMKIIYQLECC